MRDALTQANAGRAFIHQQAYGSSSLSANGLNYVALSNDAVTENASDFANVTGCPVLLVRKSWWPSRSLAEGLARELGREPSRALDRDGHQRVGGPLPAGEHVELAVRTLDDLGVVDAHRAQQPVAVERDRPPREVAHRRDDPVRLRVAGYLGKGYRAFYEQHKLDYVGLRYMNIYGPRMDYKGAYVNIDKAKNSAQLLRKLVQLNDTTFLFWGADESGDVFTGYTFTLESGFPDKAIEIVVQTQTASVSLLQRRLRVGYTRAGRLVDMLERRGIISGYEGSKPRRVLVDEAELERGAPVEVLGDWFRLTLVFNPGAAFSLGTSATVFLSLFAMVETAGALERARRALGAFETAPPAGVSTSPSA